ncbi:OmpA/MotB family protein [Sedimentisphaera salicampi]|uniref:Inner membrane lipoprotein YiaD n=1 Tax=Sedimentisphaera salicampi TaxID=1941349 RepID=A0A1W6LKB5_9BACT|nr:OmpA family protein [Sedimentisphaera salicampi]ARN56217.1 Inner membrane lipoprotein YiaD precursor [Sedimentisphaera salicampi]
MKSALLKLSVLAVAAMVLTGCTDWKKKYEGLNVQYENLQGRYDNCMSSLDEATAAKSSLSSELQSKENEIAELQSKIEDLNQTPEDATGFGEDYEVEFDADKGTITVTLQNTILFAPGKASLKSARNADLNHIYSVIQSEYAGKEIDVVGHTDSDPIRKSDWDDNWELSAQRALSVLRYLTDQGIPDSKIRAVACGESRPVASNATASGKQKNRRVEIVVNMKS